VPKAQPKGYSLRGRACGAHSAADDAAAATTHNDPAAADDTAAAATEDDDDEADMERLVPSDGVHCSSCGVLCKQLVAAPLGPGDYYLVADTHAHCKACDEPIPELDEI